MLSPVDVLVSELMGTAVLMSLGVGVTANLLAGRTGGSGGGPLMGALGWSLGVLAGGIVGHSSGAHLNPAVTVGLLVSGADALAPGVPVTTSAIAAYLTGQLLGAVLGSVLAWAAYRQHLDAPRPLAADVLRPGPPGTAAGSRGDGLRTVSVFATGPAIRSLPQNALSEAVATSLLIVVLLRLGGVPSGLGPLGAALVVLGIGLGMGGPTGWAINPARDLGARIAHALLPIRGKSAGDWGYAWVPVVGPLTGAVVAGALVGLT